jgi:hypothetical protein
MTDLFSRHEYLLLQSKRKEKSKEEKHQFHNLKRETHLKRNLEISMGMMGLELQLKKN